MSLTASMPVYSNSTMLTSGGTAPNLPSSLNGNSTQTELNITPQAVIRPDLNGLTPKQLPPKLNEAALSKSVTATDTSSRLEVMASTPVPALQTSSQINVSQAKGFSKQKVKNKGTTTISLATSSTEKEKAAQAAIIQQQAEASWGWLNKLPKPLLHFLKKTLLDSTNKAWVDQRFSDVSTQGQELSSHFDQWQQNFLNWAEILPHHIQKAVLRPLTQNHDTLSQLNQRDLTAISTLNPMSYLLTDLVKDQIVCHILTRQQAQIDALVADQQAQKKPVTYLF